MNSSCTAASQTQSFAGGSWVTMLGSMFARSGSLRSGEARYALSCFATFGDRAKSFVRTITFSQSSGLSSLWRYLNSVLKSRYFSACPFPFAG